MVVSETRCVASIEASDSISAATKQHHVWTLRKLAKDNGIRGSEWERLYDSSVVHFILDKYKKHNTAKNKFEALVKLWRSCAEIREIVPQDVCKKLQRHMVSQADLAEAEFESGRGSKLHQKGVITWHDITRRLESGLLNDPAAFGTMDHIFFSILVKVYVPRNELRLVRVCRVAAAAAAASSAAAESAATAAAADSADSAAIVEEAQRQAASAFPGENWLLVLAAGSSGVLVLNQYKTHKVYDSSRLVVPADIMRSVARMMECQRDLHDPVQQTHLFISEFKRQPFPDSAAFSNWVKKISLRHVGKAYTINDYRHIYASALNMHASKAELEQAAARMHHSLDRHLGYRVDAVLEEERQHSDAAAIRQIMERMGLEEFDRLSRAIRRDVAKKRD